MSSMSHYFSAFATITLVNRYHRVIYSCPAQILNCVNKTKTGYEFQRLVCMLETTRERGGFGAKIRKQRWRSRGKFLFLF